MTRVRVVSLRRLHQGHVVEAFPVREKKDGFVYFATVNDSTPIKIGWSENPGAAAWESSRWTWFRIKIAATIPVPVGSGYWGTGYHGLESTLNRALEEYNVQSEWFSRSDPVIEILGMAKNGCTPREAALWAAYREKARTA